MLYALKKGHYVLDIDKMGAIEMTRTFLHSFEPPSLSPVIGKRVTLDVTEIEDAGIREVLQTPGVAYGAWSILNTLLTPTGPGTPFIFQEPLGKAREVKVALSGLFGRFVARAYLERYFNLSIFAHLGNRSIVLARGRSVKVKRLAPGDLPDWIACASDLTGLTVAEAKGSHDVAGPNNALERAWKQANRINITAAGRIVTVKRIAIATRWGVDASTLTDAHLAIRDPVDEGQPIKPEENDALFIGLLRLHIASLIKSLGHADLASALSTLSDHVSGAAFEANLQLALKLLDAVPVKEVENAPAIADLVGGIVTRAGPLASADVAPSDQEMLDRLDLRPVFVGIDRELIRAAIGGEPDAVRTRLTQTAGTDDFARTDRAGGWIVPLGKERRINRSARRGTTNGLTSPDADGGGG